MNKSDLIDALADHVGGRAAAAKAVETFVDTVTRAVSAGEKVAISGFGVFEKADRAARTGRNPATGAVVKIKKTSVPKFRPGTDFKAYVAGSKKLAKAPAKAATKAASTAAGKATAAAAAAVGRATGGSRTARTTGGSAKTGTSSTAAKSTAAKSSGTTTAARGGGKASKAGAKAAPAKSAPSRGAS